ncbi:MAG: DUF1501 domain-containing protein [bacterium]
MQFTRREFMRGGVAAFTVGFAAPAFLSELARAQSATGRSLVVLYLSGGNDALSTLVPYTDPSYYSRRPGVAVPASNVLQVGADLSGHPLGLHPSLTGLKSIFDAGRLAIIQRTGYADASRSHFKGTDILATANPQSAQGTGWLGRYLDTLPSPVDPLSAWNTANLLPHALQAATVGVPSIPNATEYAFSSPNTGVEAEYSAAASLAMSSHLPVEQPQLSFVNSTAQAALATLDRVGAVAAYVPTAVYPDTGVGRALQAVAGSLATQVGTKIFWVQTGGYDTHASQGTVDGGYAGLLSTLDGGLSAFYEDLSNQGLLNQTMVLQFSEFGRRVSENGSAGTDHGAGGLMLALGGGVQGGLYGTAATLDDTPDNPTLENNGRDVKYETDFRAVYARVIDDWLGTDSVSLLGGDFRNSAVDFV